MISETTRALIQRLKRYVIANVVMTTAEEMQEIAALPVLNVYAPRLKQRFLNEANQPTIIKNLTAGTARILPPNPIYDLTYQLEIITDSADSLLQLGEKTDALFHVKPYLSVPVGEGYEYPTRLEPFGASGRTFEDSGIKRSFASLVVEGVEIPMDEYAQLVLVDGSTEDVEQAGTLVAEGSFRYTNERTGAQDVVPVEFRKEE